MEKESVWDYPRPPRVEKFPLTCEIVFDSQIIAKTTSALRVIETSHPPVYYFPQTDIDMRYLKQASGASYCEWKGEASYWDLEIDGKKVERVAWSYASPTAPFISIANHLAFYADKFERCLVDGQTVKPQPGGFYGGWITDNLVGPFKGAPGTLGW